MKKALFILFFCFLAMSVNAINDSLRFSYCIDSSGWINGRMPSYTKSIQVLDSIGSVIKSEEYLREGATMNGTSVNIPDSIFRITSRDVYQYDPSLNLISDVHTYFNSTDTFINEFLYRYDVTGKKVVTENYGLYPSPVTLMGFDSTGYSGDSISYYLSLRWDGVSFDTSSYYIINYDSLNRKIFEMKHMINGSFYGITRTYWSYLVSGEIDQIITNAWYGDSTRVTYSYNAFNDISSTLSEEYNPDSSGWVSPRRLDYIYDANNYPYRIIYVPCFTPACLDTVIYKEWNYDSLGRLTRLLLSNFEGQAFSLHTYSYDANGDTTYAGFMYDDGGPCGAGNDVYYYYNLDRSVVHTHNLYFSCDYHISDCYYYDLGADSMLVDISYPFISCSNDTIYPIVFSAGGVSPQTYNWSTGIYFSDSTSSQPYLITEASNVYTLTVIDSFGRSVSDTMNGGVSIPFPNLGSDTIVCTNSMIELQPGLFYSYEWNDGSTLPSLQLSSSLEDSNFVSVAVRDSYGCYGTDSVLVVFNDCTGIQEIENISSVYPNPFHDRIIIKNDGENSVCYIYSHDGRMIKSFQLQFGENKIETTDLIAGIYVLVIDNEKNHRLNYIIKE